MTKNNKKNIKTKLAARKLSRALARATPNGPANLKKAMNRVMISSTKPRVNFGPVTTIDTAPVAIGNSVRGSATDITTTRKGVVIRGRDFMFSAVGSGTIATWCTVGGTPITAACFTDSCIRQYMQLYQKFKVNKIVAHYITSSATSSTGDVMFYYQKNANSVYLNQTSTQLLPFVMSDPNTVLGPQWTNHSTSLVIEPVWRSTDYGMDANLNDYSAGNLFLLSKTSTTDSPGYVIFDYEIEFAEMQVSPRLLTLPISRIQWSQVNIGRTALAVTNGTTPVTGLGALGNNITGTASALPSGVTTGDIYKVIIDLTNSNSGSWTNCTANNLLVTRLPNSNYTGVSLVDGTTYYAVIDNTNSLDLFATAEEAFAGGLGISGFYYGTTATVTYNLQCWFSYVGSLSSNNTQPNF